MILFMSLTVLTCYPQKPDIESFPGGSEAKNPLPTGVNEPWMEVAGLSWIFLEDDFT